MALMPGLDLLLLIPALGSSSNGKSTRIPITRLLPQLLPEKARIMGSLLHFVLLTIQSSVRRELVLFQIVQRLLIPGSSSFSFCLQWDMPKMGIVVLASMAPLAAARQWKMDNREVHLFSRTWKGLIWKVLHFDNIGSKLSFQEPFPVQCAASSFVILHRWVAIKCKRIIADFVAPFAAETLQVSSFWFECKKKWGIYACYIIWCKRSFGHGNSGQQ